MEKNRKITFENGKFNVYGKEITMLGGMYCLNDLFSAMDEQGIERQQLGQYVRNKSFLRLVECTTGVKICNVTFVISKLCEKGLMKRVGRREEAKLYASLPIMWCILTDYNDTLTKDAADVLVLNRSFNSVGYNMKEPSNFEEITAYLLSLIPKEEIEKREGTLGEFYPEFVGFVDIYYYLSKVIPKDYTIIDFGAGHNPQSYFFTEHKKYIAVNPLSGIKEDDGMFCPHNCEIYRMTTGEFLNTIDYTKEKVFAICNFVPNWHGEDSIKLVHDNFRNCYTFYPEHG